MPTAFYDDIFTVPVAFRRPCGGPPKRRPAPGPADELEFSEYGRSASIPAGWYLLPGLVIVAVLAAIPFLVTL